MDASIASANKSTFEERQKNVSYLRTLYFLFSLEFIIAILWCVFTTTYVPSVGAWIVDWWYFALFAAILCVLLILITFFVPAVRRAPVNIAIYAIFVLAFAYCWSYLVNRFAEYQVAWYILWLLAAVAIGFALYSWVSSNYLTSFASMILIIASTLVVFHLFLIFSKIKFMWLLLLLVPVIIFGFYLNYDIRTMVRTSSFDSAIEDAVSGAVRIWLEAITVFCRFMELVGRMFYKSKH